MQPWLSHDVLCLLVCEFLDGVVLAHPFLALCFERAGLGVSAVPYVFLVASTVTILLEVPSGALADLWGRAPTLRLARFLRLLSYGVLAIWPTPLGAFSHALFGGAASAMTSGTGSALLYDRMLADGTAKEHYHQVTGFSNAAWPVGAAVGSLLGTGVAAFTENALLTQRVLALSCLPLFLALLLTVFVQSEPPKQHDATSCPERPLTMREVWRQTWRGARAAVADNALRPLLFASTVIWACGELLHFMDAIVLRDAVGLPVEGLGPVNVLVFAASAVGHALSSRLSRTFGSKRVLITCTVLSPLLTALALTGILPLPAALFFYIVPSVCFGVRNPIFDAAVQHQVRSDIRATVGSVFSLAQQGGVAVASPLVSLLTWVAGPRWAFETLMIIYLVLAPAFLSVAQV